MAVPSTPDQDEIRPYWKNVNVPPSHLELSATNSLAIPGCGTGHLSALDCSPGLGFCISPHVLGCRLQVFQWPAHQTVSRISVTRQRDVAL